jgi:tetratricopeptide (TPR) repeat protein
LEAARAEHAAQPDSEAATIWVGRRLAYLGRYEDALEWTTQGIARFPTSYRLLRHRGHRRITLRRFADAIADLERASELMLSAADAIEPDGAPNARGIPRTTDRFNVWYHLGLAHYLAGNDVEAARAWRACLEVARANDDMLVATSYWLVLVSRRMGREAEAQALLASIHAGMDVIENHGYLRLLLFFRGNHSEQEHLLDTDREEVERATLGYGLGAWALANGERERAQAHFEALVRDPAWAAFGHIAAEVELARLRSTP